MSFISNPFSPPSSQNAAPTGGTLAIPRAATNSNTIAATTTTKTNATPHAQFLGAVDDETGSEPTPPGVDRGDFWKNEYVSTKKVLEKTESDCSSLRAAQSSLCAAQENFSVAAVKNAVANEKNAVSLANTMGKLANHFLKQDEEEKEDEEEEGEEAASASHLTKPKAKSSAKPAGKASTNTKTPLKKRSTKNPGSSTVIAFTKKMRAALEQWVGMPPVNTMVIWNGQVATVTKHKKEKFEITLPDGTTKDVSVVYKYNPDKHP